MVKILSGILLILTSISLWCGSASAQGSCLSGDELQKILAQMEKSTPASLNKKLKEQLLKLTKKSERRLLEAVADNQKDDSLLQEMRASREEDTAQLCLILKTFGWPSTALAGKEGVAAAFLLLRNSTSPEMQLELLPLIVAATLKGELPRNSFAAYFDHVRLNAGLKQLFGTQATIMDGFLTLYPIEDPEQVDARRKQYGLVPLAEHVRALERIYQLPLIRSTGKLHNFYADGAKSAIASAATKTLFGESVDEGEVIRIETKLVNLNVTVYSKTLRTQVASLEPKDFAITEDEHDQTTSFFATTDVPFDLVLLLDISGSTGAKRSLIQKSTERFIKAARPRDRLAIVTFADNTNVISPLTEDRQQLLMSVKKIEGKGGSMVWKALKFTLDQVIPRKTVARRRAVVFMTDGVDNSLVGGGAAGNISFADLLEAVRQSEVLIVPICLDTQGVDYPLLNRMYENARKTLALLANESGGLYYKATKLEDLEGVYDQVIEDLGTVYSLGYRPTNAKRDGSWRSVKVQIPTRPELTPRTRPGYYAN